MAQALADRTTPMPDLAAALGLMAMVLADLALPLAGRPEVDLADRQRERHQWLRMEVLAAALAETEWPVGHRAAPLMAALAAVVAAASQAAIQLTPVEMGLPAFLAYFLPLPEGLLGLVNPPQRLPLQAPRPLGEEDLAGRPALQATPERALMARSPVVAAAVVVRLSPRIRVALVAKVVTELYISCGGN